MAPSRPRLILMAAATLDGCLDPAPLGSAEDRAWLEEMRRATDAGIMGAGTLRRADPRMAGPGGQPPPGRLRCVVSGSGRLPLERTFFRLAPRPVVFTAAAPSPALSAAAAAVVRLPAGQDGTLRLADVAGHLAGLGVATALIEGGGGLCRAAFAEDLVDEICLTLVPRVAGDRDSARLAAPWRQGFAHLAYDLLSCRTTTAGEVMLRYRRRTPAPA